MADKKWNRKIREDDRLLKANVLLERPGTALAVSLIMEVLLLFLIHILINVMIRFCTGHLTDFLTWECVTTFYSGMVPLYITLAAAGILVAGLNIYRFRVAFRDLEAGQKGTSAFATRSEIRQQYIAVGEVPKKDADGNTVRIPGNGGLPVACKDGRMYLDMSATNTLILAITRAGCPLPADTQGSIFSQLLTKLSQYTFGGIEQLTAQSGFEPEELGFGDQPVALFLQVPFYDSSKDAIAVSMIDQIYQANARACIQSKNGRCARRVIFHLDEIAQFPPIENLDSKLSICLGLNMCFNLIIQTDAQLTHKYGEAAKIIKGNCGNQVYLQTSEKETAELFSSLLGNRTITAVNRSGGRFSLGKTYTESVEERPLLTPRELMDLEEGENVVLRTMYRRDLDGRKIKPRPIFNSEKQGRAFLYRYQYLTESFPDADTVSEEELGLPTLAAIPPEDMMYDFEESFRASQYQIGRQEIAELNRRIEKLQKGHVNELAAAEMDSEIEECQNQLNGIQASLDELDEKKVYQWDTRIYFPDGKNGAEYERQFEETCRELDRKYSLGIKERFSGGCTAGRLMGLVTCSGASLEEKKKLLDMLLPNIA